MAQQARKENLCAYRRRLNGNTYADAETTTRYPSGDDPETLAKIGNVADASLAKEFGIKVNNSWGSIHADDGFLFTSPVGKFQPNAFGLYDMVGNATNWCSDFWGENYYAASPVDDPKGPTSGAFKVIRGGGWYGNTLRCRSARCEFDTPGSRYHFLGFRVVRELYTRVRCAWKPSADQGDYTCAESPRASRAMR